MVRVKSGKEFKILDANGFLPKDQRFVVGENTKLYL